MSTPLIEIAPLPVLSIFSVPALFSRFPLKVPVELPEKAKVFSPIIEEIFPVIVLVPAVNLKVFFPVALLLSAALNVLAVIFPAIVFVPVEEKVIAFNELLSVFVPEALIFPVIEEFPLPEKVTVFVPPLALSAYAVSRVCVGAVIVLLPTSSVSVLLPPAFAIIEPLIVRDAELVSVLMVFVGVPPEPYTSVTIFPLIIFVP